MHTEHLQNVRVVHVVAGWLIAIASTSLFVFVLLAFGFLGDPLANERSSNFWSMVAVALGFAAGGFFAGFRALNAPILHAVAIGITSLIVWVVLDLIASAALPEVMWENLTPALALGLVLVQMAAAVFGALLGYNLALRGKPGLSEHEPLPD